MPRTEYIRKLDLMIQNDNQRTYRPGEIVSGTVKLRPPSEHLQYSVERVKMTFWGRVKTKMVFQQGEQRRTYRGRATLFTQEVQLTQIDEPDPDPSITRTWRFEATIPVSPDPATLGDSWDQDRSFLSTKGDVSKHPLPSTFHHSNRSGFKTKRSEAYTEYVLTANVHLAKPGKNFSISEYTTDMPVTLHASGTHRPLDDFEMQVHSDLIFARTLQLLPDRQHSSLTFREKMRTHFKPSHIPQFAFKLMVQHPTRIQLDNPTLPFILRIHPCTEEVLTSIPLSDYPKVEITSFSLTLISNSNFRAHGSLSNTHRTNATDKHVIYHSDHRLKGIEEVNIALPPDPSNAFDLGKHLRLSLQRTHHTTTAGPPSLAAPDPTNSDVNTDSDNDLPPSSASFVSTTASTLVPSSASFASTLVPHPQSSTQRPDPPMSGPVAKEVTPSFATYNIAVTHQLKWTLRLLVCGTDEVKKVEGLAAVTVVSAATLDV